MSTQPIIKDQTEQISFDKDQVEFIYSVSATAMRLINAESSQAAQDLIKAFQQIMEFIASKGDISITDIGINTA